MKKKVLIKRHAMRRGVYIYIYIYIYIYSVVFFLPAEYKVQLKMAVNSDKDD